MEERDQEKKDRLLASLDKGMVMVHLDARRPGVDVPEPLRREAHLRLNLSYKFDPPDLSITAWGVRATLSFSGRRYPVAIPWSALFAVTSHVSQEFWMYPDDMPEELVQSPQPRPKVEGPGGSGPPPNASGPRRVVLQEVKGGKDADGEDGSGPLSGAGGGLADAPEQAPPPELQPAAGAAAPGPSEDAPEKPRGRGHLRVVK